MLCVTSQDLEPDDNSSFYILNVGQPQSAVNQPIGIPRYGLQTHAPVGSAPSRLQAHKAYDPGYEYGPAAGHRVFECPSIQITSISPSCPQDMEAGEDGLGGTAAGPDGEGQGQGQGQDQCLSRGHLYLPLDPSYRDSSLSPSPCSSLSSRSWFSDASSCESFSQAYDDVESELNEAAARFTLGSPLASPGEEPWLLQHQQQQQHQHQHQQHQQQQQQQQRHPAFPRQLSPRQSPCHSPRASVTDENWLSPRPPSQPSSRPASPCGKRRHSSADICYPGSASPRLSPAPTPGHSPRGSVTEDTWAGSPSSSSAAAAAAAAAAPPPFHCCSAAELDVPSKTRKTSQDRPPLSGTGDTAGLEDPGSVSPSRETPLSDDGGGGGGHGLRKDGSAEQFLSVPSHFTWNKPKPGHTPIFRTSSLPPLDWPLPSQFGQYELKIEVHPRAHHRAHYETEGSRGAVKASSGAHPVVKLLGYNEKPVNLQMFIGTADDRYLRPHAFYQVHRITGKTVATPSQEIIITSTKVLEIPLLPENNMSASIDCAGILKLRNSDIELRKGETDIGRKNTRVRVVFRVHIPQLGGKVLSLQAASIPVECSQRSAQELPQVDKCSLTSCSVNGGEEMAITGSNFCPESKVVFLEKGPDGRPQWEVEAKIIREKSQGANIVVEVPPYHSKTVTSAVQVQFYVCNGKRKRSQSQRFSYLSVLVKQEQRDEQDVAAAPSMRPPMSVAPPPSQPNLHLLRNQLSPPDSGQVHDSLLASPPRGLVPGLTHPQPAYSPAGSASFQHLPGLQGHGLSPGSDCQLMSPPPAFHPAPTRALPPPARPSYQPMQHNLAYNGQSSLPMSAGSSPAYERMTYQPDPAASHPLGLGMVYHPPTMASGSAPGQSLHSHTPPHQHSLGYHCHGVPQVPSPTHPMAPPPSQLQHSLGYHSGSQNSASCPSPTTSPLPMAPSPSQLQHSLGYHSGSQSSASYPSPTTSPLPMAPSPSQMQHSLGYHSGSQSSASYPSPTTSPLPMAPPPSQMQHSLGYHSGSQSSASCPSPTTSPLPMAPSPSQMQHSLSYHSSAQNSASCPSPTTSPLPMAPSPSQMQHSLSYHSSAQNSASCPSPTTSPLPMALSPSQMQHSLGYHSSAQNSASCPSPTTSPLPMAPPASQMQHSLGYHSSAQNSASCPSPTTSPLPMAPPPSQMQHSVGYHSGSQSSASCPSPTTSPLPMGLSSCSGPSSPQLHSLPYRSPTGSTPSPTPSSPLMHQPSPSAVSPLGHTLAPQPPFAPDGERPSIKQEPEDKEPTFRSIGLQDITLDDVNEIIGRDMSPPGPQS
ncbi:nuclear factor of activated T-cells, cytoplasmic 3-like isoform X2 [Anguilla anguilla]|uniref:nuclear factor of activated T-cells, cytoplasmic 3-like isoform X2 n=1 Tax=Anguilla anguilla TaxID=7936 RepID=UPI0015ACD040|nr:nuclear factor of activated T-cells, cytoplasmic 3-like isoform X2 [Anguilla anguilla]